MVVHAINQQALLKAIGLLKCLNKNKPAFLFALLYNADLMSNVNNDEVEVEVHDDEIVLRKKVKHVDYEYFYDPLVLHLLSFSKVNVKVNANAEVAKKAVLTFSILSKFRDVRIESPNASEIELPKWLSHDKEEIMKMIEKKAMRRCQ